MALIAHVLRHGKTDVWIKATSSPDNPREAEADSFSRDTLIPRGSAKALPSLRTLRRRAALRRQCRHSARIVIGRLQHDSLWPYSQGNQLKRPLSFPAIADE
jgi:HTH-type transcriptional regulator/antitoxin HigA